MNYYIDLFTGKSWHEFRQAGGTVTGFRESRRKYLERINPGDIFLCYMTGVMRWVGSLEVVGLSNDARPIWTQNPFPVRFEVRPLVVLDPENGVPMNHLEGKVQFFEGPQNRGKFKGFVRTSPNIFQSSEDGELVNSLVFEAMQSPEHRPVDPKRLAYQPLLRAERKEGKNIIPAKVTVPEPESDVGVDSRIDKKSCDVEYTKHTEIQYHLLSLGAEMGFDLWVARNDRGKIYDGKRFDEHLTILDSLPTQFNEATPRTIEFIDVLWLRGNSIEAAFEVESTTSVYSGLLRMSDLLALQPNLDIRLFIVAPEARRKKVRDEILRPTFELWGKPLSNICGFLPFSEFMTKVEGIRTLGLGSSLKSDFLEKSAEYFYDEKSEEVANATPTNSSG